MQSNNAEQMKIVMPVPQESSLLSEEEELELCKRAAGGDESAKEKLIYCNQRLVAMIAFKYVGVCHGLEFDDLKQAGNIGLMQAVKLFDYTKGFRFSTYAVWWIRQAITREISDKDRTIRIPVHVNEQIIKIRKAAAKIEQETGNTASAAEIAAAVDIPLEKVEDLWDLAWGNPVVSLDKPVGDDGDITIENFLADEENTPQKDSDAEQIKSQVAAAVALLPPREQAVIKMRFGLADGIPHTLEEIGERYGVTRERVRQILCKAIRKLSSPKIKALLKELR